MPESLDYSNLVKWYIKREEHAISENGKHKELFLKALRENPEVYIDAVKANIESDVMFACMEIGKSVSADTVHFPKLLVDAFKKYFLEGVKIDLTYN